MITKKFDLSIGNVSKYVLHLLPFLSKARRSIKIGNISVFSKSFFSNKKSIYELENVLNDKLLYKRIHISRKKHNISHLSILNTRLENRCKLGS